jgi:hypothetical protein
MTIIILSWYYAAGKDPRPIHVNMETVVEWHRDDINGGTLLRVIHGNPIFVRETPEEIDALIRQSKPETTLTVNTKGDPDVTGQIRQIARATQASRRKTR